MPAPSRLITSHVRPTLPEPVGDPASGRIVGREFHLHAVAGEDADEVDPHLARNMGQHLVPGRQLHAKHRIGEHFDHGPLNLDDILLGHRLLRRRRGSGCADGRPDVLVGDRLPPRQPLHEGGRGRSAELEMSDVLPLGTRDAAAPAVRHEHDPRGFRRDDHVDGARVPPQAGRGEPPQQIRRRRFLNQAKKHYTDSSGESLVRTIGPSSPTATVCSKCADGLWSRVRTVHPSASMTTSEVPMLTIGSIASVIPRRSTTPLPGLPKFGICGSSWSLRPIPWPANSRTTENPCCSTYRWIAAPTSPRRPSGRIARMPISRASAVTRSSRATAGDTFPTGTVTARSPWNPSSTTPRSRLMISPSTSRRGPGIPCTTSSFTEVQMLAGNPRDPRNDGSPPNSRIRASAIRSSWAVVAPGRTAATTVCRAWAAACPARRIAARSVAVFTMIMGWPPAT